MRYLILILAMLQLWATAATYKCELDDGSTQYSDHPCPGAEEVELPNISTYESPTPAQPASRNTGDAEGVESTGIDAGGGEAAASSERVIEVLSPTADQTFTNIGGQLQVSIRVSPSLEEGQGVMAYFDGNPIELEPTQSTSFTVSEVYRGEHTVRATVVAEGGRVLAQSETVTFYVRQRSIANPP